ncbi:phenylacetate-coenzyme A ligase PaaK-like adenylate-forming protein [Ureibacillus xyleni]|uniref:Phenylacetate-coenzyme A ligase PaaK-like adenylate-forming protein n=1 Tax=Ureibacillus xyleni TaxID=614648 RepID=A0A285RB63_9BACL|nr:acyl-protein synthetase [Ureibacillus xyleni]SOB91321.1 phenylacetate-coenzyme A ligase PaaK-like adenylate-forming protein [Ureibacillus xyleni]
MTIPYHLTKTEKESQLLAKLNDLTKWHIENSPEYKAMLEKSSAKEVANCLEEVPHLPVQLFKLMDLKSIPQENVVKVLTSSGTTGQQVSKIYLDKDTSVTQTKTLVEVMKPILGNKRLPMIILDTKSVLKDRKSFSARGAGILGFSNFGRKHFYALNDDMTLDVEGLQSYLKEYAGQRILLFGFTFMIWQYIYKESLKQEIKLDFGDSILIHGGGWKKLKDEAVDTQEFNQLLHQQLGIREIHNYYGMVEQVGSIFVECSHGYLHTPSYADVIIRNPITFEPVPFGEQGLIQVLSELPKSYPGHSLLTEDLGTILGEDDCSCGWKGKYFNVAGRIPKAELRGCSDTFQGGGVG